MSKEISRKSPSLDIDIDALISANKSTIHDALNNTMGVADASILQGTLNFCHSKLSSYILDTISYQYQLCNKIDKESEAQQLLVFEKLNSDIRSVGNIIDKVWIDIHHPAIKSYQSLFLQLSKSKDTIVASNKKQNSSNKFKYHNLNSNGNNNNSQNYVEYRKLFDKFVKLISKALDFYFTLLQTALSQYDLSIYIPVKKICTTLKLDLNPAVGGHLLPRSNLLISSIVYLIHKCVLYIGDLSRYRTLVAKTYLPSTSISKEDNNNYSKSIELYKLSLLILPSLGDPYNHIAIIDNFKDDKFNVVYNFVRASLTSTPLDLAQSNLLNLLNKNPKSNAILRKFENLNGLDRQKITKNDRLSLLKSQFLVLFNYNLLPAKWRSKPGFLVSGHEIKMIEDDFFYLLSTLDFHKQIFNDFYLKQVVILLGGFELLIDPKNMENLRLKQSAEIIADYLAFMFRFLENLLRICIKICNDPQASGQQQTLNVQESSQKLSMAFSTSLLPVIRLLLCWFKEREIARVYLARSENVASLLAILINRLISYLEDATAIDTLKKLLPSDTEWDINNILSKKPLRTRLFKEDVALREFKPINYMMDDFDDLHFFKKDANAVLALIGELPSEDSSKADNKSSTTKFNDNILRLVAIIVLGKRLVLENAKNIQWVPVMRKADDSDTAANTSIGSFVVEKNVDLNIQPIVLKHESKTENAKGKEQKPKKRTMDLLNSNSSSANASTYAGSSFSNFGFVPPGSFAKLERPRRNKSSSILERPKTVAVDKPSNNSSEVSKRNSKTDGKLKSLERPITAPLNVTRPLDYQQHSYSQYVDMVANIVNDDKKDEVMRSKSSNEPCQNDKSASNGLYPRKSVNSFNQSYEHLFNWNSESQNNGIQMNSSKTSDSQINSNPDSNILSRFGFTNMGNTFNTVRDESMPAMFEMNSMGPFDNMNLGINRMVHDMSNYNSYNTDVNKYLGGDSNYMSNVSNLNMGLNNFMQSPLSGISVGDLSNMNMNINSGTTPMNVSNGMQDAINYMNSYKGFNNSFNCTNSEINQFSISSEDRSRMYRSDDSARQSKKSL